MSPDAGRVLYVVVCAAPAAAGVADLVLLAQAAGWRVHVIATPLGLRFIDADRLASLTGEPVRSEWRMPGEPKALPPADAAIVAPATFNTINKWATGITDTFAVGVLCELAGCGVPIVAGADPHRACRTSGTVAPGERHSVDARAEIGRRIARQRRRRGLSQAVLAQLVGRSESWLSQVERGLRSIDSHSVLVQLAEILGVDISQLTPSETGTETVKYEPVAGIREAMMRYGALPGAINSRANGSRRPSLRWLRHEVRRANGLYQAARYDDVGRLLPGVIDAAEEARVSCPAAERRTADALRALVYHSVTMTLSRVGEPELAWAAADRSVAAAESMADVPVTDAGWGS